MSTHHSRKSFFTHLVGILAVVGLTPRLFAKSRADAPAQAAGDVPFKIQSDSRAVARSADVR
ncbi:hypothetical protein [Nibricoccus sp. IMCC34717]|uniref:hypothetical protein n=1 Tax=Nibricoccus sp. IMCC34717 TaxID=3034021 RepID=UPI00384D664C